MMTAPFPNGPVLLNGIFYQPVPAPHNVVVAQSSIPAPTMVPCTPAAEPSVPAQNAVSAPPAAEPAVPAPTAVSAPPATEPAVPAPAMPIEPEKPRVGLEFAMPETPPPKKSVSKKSINGLWLTSRSRSRSSSKQREKRKSPKASPEKPTIDVRPTGRGRGRKKPEMTNAPIIVPTTHSHLISTAKLKPGLTVNLSTENPIPRSVQHLSQLTTEASARLETTSKSPAETTVTLNPQPIYEESDVDLETGEVLVPMKTSNAPSKFSYKLKPHTVDYEAFAQAITAREAPLWDRELILAHADLFYHAYFQDHQTITELRQKAQARIQFFNVRVMRQEEKNDEISSSQTKKLQLEAKFRSTLRQMYEAFEEAYTLEQPELIEDLREHLVKPAIAQITGLFVSSRCCTCFGGRHQTAVWRLSRFDTLAPIMSEVPNEAYKKAEDNQAVTIFKKKPRLTPMDLLQTGSDLDCRMTTRRFMPRSPG